MCEIVRYCRFGFRIFKKSQIVCADAAETLSIVFVLVSSAFSWQFVSARYLANASLKFEMKRNLVWWCRSMKGRMLAIDFGPCRPF